MKEWKIVLGTPGKIIVGDVRVESNMVDARTHSMLNRKVGSMAASSELSLPGFLKLTDVTLSEHNNREYQESGKYKTLLFRKNDIYFVYDENQPKVTAFQEDPEPAPQRTDLIQKKSHQLELTTSTSGNSYYRINGLFTGFLKSFEEHDFIQLSNAIITEYLKREDGFIKLKYDKKSLISVNTSVLEAVFEIETTA